MGEIPLEVAMHAERLYDEGGYESIPTIIAKAILGERERCALIAEEKGQHWDSPKGYEREACNQVAEAIRKDGEA